MYTLIQLLSLKQVFAEQLPIMLASLIIAELFYKFRSFTLETAAFLATWYGIDYVVHSIRKICDKYQGDARQE
jgi:hypothetical protein